MGCAAGLDASSRDEFTCCREADALFMEKDECCTMYATKDVIRWYCKKRFTKMDPDQERMTPIASTVPGIEYGSTERISRTPFPFGLMRLITYATITPKEHFTIPAVTDQEQRVLDGIQGCRGGQYLLIILQEKFSGVSGSPYAFTRATRNIITSGTTTITTNVRQANASRGIFAPLSLISVGPHGFTLDDIVASGT